jgi:hypothetical protein
VPKVGLTLFFFAPQVLHLDNNKMFALPVAIGGLHSLEELKIAGNDLRDPPAKILNGGIKAPSHPPTRVPESRESAPAPRAADSPLPRVPRGARLVRAARKTREPQSGKPSC